MFSPNEIQVVGRGCDTAECLNRFRRRVALSPVWSPLPCHVLDISQVHLVQFGPEFWGTLLRLTTVGVVLLLRTEPMVVLTGQ